MRFDGTLQSWNDERGYGFIEPAAGGEPVFVHIKDFPHLGERPRPGQRVSFEVAPGREGRKRAVRVEPAEKAPRRKAALPTRPTRQAPRQVPAWSTASRLALPAFIFMLITGYALGHPPRWLLALYPLASLVTFIVYAVDKSAAQAGAWRVSERTLHLLALIGGWPGALVAHQVLRHKSAKAAFLAVFWVTVVLNAVAFAWLASPYGQAIGLQWGNWPGR